ncbi:hypothetical protein KFK09_018190 [Dendrobium nobile]|uniref:Uncharacterized protein n=1 Tax=Dendrobium nobile TaxID=94219 RepID=A0A8T3AWA7_DENNO|nr:hypothetical protein KFK09_018190 [Dendrobium nobile]
MPSKPLCVVIYVSTVCGGSIHLVLYKYSSVSFCKRKIVLIKSVHLLFLYSFCLVSIPKVVFLHLRFFMVSEQV